MIIFLRGRNFAIDARKGALRALRSRVNIAKKPLDVKATKSQQDSNHTVFQACYMVFTGLH
jgi:hypothetical protein